MVAGVRTPLWRLFLFIRFSGYLQKEFKVGLEKSSSRKDFLWGRYRALQNFREKLLFDADSLEDKRHDIHLRTLVDCGDFDEALAYVDEMAFFCEGISDFVAAEIYRRYRNRVSGIKESQVELEA